MADPGDVNLRLSQVYYNPRNNASFGGERKFLASVKDITHECEAKEWLRGQDTFTLHRPVRYKYPMLHYRVSNIDDLWECDLIDLQSIKSYNDGYGYILVCIDVLSKYVWVEPLKNKSNESVKKALEIIFQRNGRKPLTLQSDCGKEFVGKSVQKFLKTEDIQFRTTRNPDVKAAVVERFNRTLKSRMFRYFTYSNTKRYIDVLQQLTDAYNHTKHSSIKMEPASVTLANAQEAMRNIRAKYKPISRVTKYKVHQLVRISRKRNTFEKGYEAGWSEELFRISKVLGHRKPPVYELKDLNGEEIDGFFYEEELNPVSEKPADAEYIVERVLKTSGRGSNKKVLVKWQGYDDSFNSWIPASDLKNL